MRVCSGENTAPIICERDLREMRVVKEHADGECTAVGLRQLHPAEVDTVGCAREATVCVAFDERVECDGMTFEFVEHGVGLRCRSWAGGCVVLWLHGSGWVGCRRSRCRATGDGLVQRFLELGEHGGVVSASIAVVVLGESCHTEIVPIRADMVGRSCS